jgi:mRNA interferase RelE/StbE
MSLTTSQEDEQEGDLHRFPSDTTILDGAFHRQKRIVGKIKKVAAAPYAQHNNVTKLQGRDGYRLRVGDWRVIYELHDDRLELWVLEVGARGGIY